MEGRKIVEIITSEQVQQRVGELAGVISRDFSGKDMLIVGILKGAKVFVEALAERLEFKAALDYVTARSYGSARESGGRVDIDFHVTERIQDRDVLVVDDIIDTGLTVQEVCNRIHRDKPRSIKTCVLCDKAARREVPVKLDYVGFLVPNRFLVGFGMGFRGQYRDLPYIGFI